MNTQLNNVRWCREPETEAIPETESNQSKVCTEQGKQELGLVALESDVTQIENFQLSRVPNQFARQTTALDRYIYLVNQRDHSERLFYRTIMSDPERFLPIVCWIA